MAGFDLLVPAGIVAAAVTGTYIMMAPRRLFTRPEDPAEYRPGAVEYDSDQGRWLRRVVGPGLIAAAVVLILVRLF